VCSLEGEKERDPDSVGETPAGAVETTALPKVANDWGANCFTAHILTPIQFDETIPSS
jgi:hypothetical protein